MDYSFCLIEEVEPKQDLYHLVMQDRTAQMGLSFYLYRLLLDSLAREI